MLTIHHIILFLLLLGFCGRYANEVNVVEQKLLGSDNKDIINIGLIINKEPRVGKVVESCVAMAIADFYKDHVHYKTRISLHVRDSREDSLHSVAAALNLLETVQVRALIITTISDEQSLIASLADNAKVPLLSFSPMSSFDKHPYFVQVAGDETDEFHGIAALIETFKWKDCAILHEDVRQAQPNLHKILLKNNIRVTYQTPVSLSATTEQFLNELRVIMSMKTSIVVVHLSPSLAFKVFLAANELGMMSKGFAYIVTTKTMNLLSSLDYSVRESMQGALGFRSYVSSSSKLQNFILRWKNESKMETRDLNVYGLWAYDAAWALAQAIEKTGLKPYNPNRGKCKLFDSACIRVSDSGQTQLNQILSSKFIGLAGAFEIKNKNRKRTQDTYEIVNVIGNGDRRVGFWNSANGLGMEMNSSNSSAAARTFDTVIWPGISLTTPTTQLAYISGKKLRVGIPMGKKRPELTNWRYDHKTNATIAAGLSVEVFRAAFDWLKYDDVSFEFFPFNGTYDDLVCQVYRQIYDVAVGDITILANRSAYVDFTCSFTDMGVGMVGKLDDKDPWFFAKPLDPSLWILCVILFVLMGCVVWLIERRTNSEFQGSAAEQLGTLLWFATSTLVFAQKEKLESNISRFVVGIWLFVVLILTSSYTANMSSLLTVQKFKLTKSDYIGSANSYVQGHVKNNLRFDDHKLKPYQRADEYDAALKSGSKNGGVTAIVDEIPYIKIFLAKYPNEYTIFQTSMTTSGFGFAFPKGSSLVPELSRAIVGLREKGKLLEMETKWFAEKTPIMSDESETPSVDALSIRDFSHLFLLNGVSELVALFLLFLIYLRPRLVRMYLNLRALAAQKLMYMLREFFPTRMGIVVVPDEIVELARI